MRVTPARDFGRRDCPGCAMPCAANENRCPICGYEFPQPGRRPAGFVWTAVALLLALLLLWFGLAGCAPAGPPPEGPARRVVSLAPSLTEILCDLGAADRLVGRTSACDTPAARPAAVVGGFGRPSIERVLLQAPDLVLDTDLEDEPLGRAIERAGIRRRQIRCRTLEDIPAAVREVGALIGEDEAAGRLAGRLEAEFAARRARPPAPDPPLVYVEIWPDPPMTAGRGSFLSDLVRLAGGRHAGDAIGREYAAVATETVLAWNPDRILLLYDAEPEAAARRIAARPGWSSLDAVAGRRILIPPDPDQLLRPGPRIVEGLEWLERALSHGIAGDPPLR